MSYHIDVTQGLEQDYLNCGGMKCPFCGSEELHWDSLENDGSDTVSQGVTCLCCGKSWWDVYNLVGIQIKD